MTIKNSRRGGFTLVEIMIVVAIIALLAAIAVPNFLRARKRSQATRMLEDLRVIDSAMDQYAIETNRGSGDTVVWADLQKYFKNGSVLYNSNGTDMLGGDYTAGNTLSVDFLPKLDSVTFSKLSDNAYAYTAEGDPNSGVVIGDDGVMVIDAQATPAMAEDVIRHELVMRIVQAYEQAALKTLRSREAKE